MFILLHICNLLCGLPATFTPAAHHSARLFDIYNEVIFTGHPLLLFTNPLKPPRAKRTSVSKWATVLIFPIFPPSYSRPGWWRMNSLTPVLLRLWGWHSSICDPFWCNWILNTECNMKHDLRVPLLLPVLVFFIQTSKRSLLRAICVWGAEVVNDDRRQTQG